MPRPRFYKLDPDKRARILQSAKEAFAANGFDGASLHQIAESAGISKGAVYYYFDDKVDLLATVMLEVWTTFLPWDALDLEALTAEGFWPSLRALYDRSVALLRDEPHLVGLGKIVYRLPWSTFEGTVFGRELARAHTMTESLLARGQELGVVRRDIPSGLLLTMLAGAAEASDRWMVDHWEQLGLEQAESLSHQLFEVFQQMLMPLGRPGAGHG